MKVTIPIEESEEYQKFLRWQEKQEAAKQEKRPQVFVHSVIHHCKICDGIFRVNFKSAWLTSPSKVHVWGCRNCQENLKNKDQEWLLQKLLKVREMILAEGKNIPPGSKHSF